MGKVTVEVEDGIVMSVMGNMVSTDGTLDDADIEKIKSLNAQQDRAHPQSTVIVRQMSGLAELPKDVEGNEFPENLSPAEKEFLKVVIPAIKQGDMKTLKTLVHKDATDDSPYDATAKFLKTMVDWSADKGVSHYRFMKYDAAHPDNRAKRDDVRHSLPVGWTLTFQYDEMYSATIEVGEDDGVLKFPTAYGN